MKITHVACKTELGIFSLPSPNRHHNIFHNLLPLYEGWIVEGFLGQDGNFYNREEGMKLAQESGQLNRLEGDQYYQGPNLYSEDLW